MYSLWKGHCPHRCEFPDERQHKFCSFCVIKLELGFWKHLKWIQAALLCFSSEKTLTAWMLAGTRRKINKVSPLLIHRVLSVFRHSQRASVGSKVHICASQVPRKQHSLTGAMNTWEVPQPQKAAQARCCLSSFPRQPENPTSSTAKTSAECILALFVFLGQDPPQLEGVSWLFKSHNASGSSGSTVAQLLQGGLSLSGSSSERHKACIQRTASKGGIWTEISSIPCNFCSHQCCKALLPPLYFWKKDLV